MSSAVATPETVTVQAEIPREGNVTVSLAQVDATQFPNYREDVKETHIMELVGLLKEHGQLNSCLGTWLPNGRIGLVAGFCRFEAMNRIALEKVIRDYNQANGKEPQDEGFISLGGHGFASAKEREKVRDAGGEWKEKYEAALRGYNINFSTIIVEDGVDAALKNIASNAYEKPPLMDLCRQIEKLLSTKDITAKRVARALKLSEPTISQHRKIHNCPAFLREKFNGDLGELGLKKPEDQQVVRDSLLTAVAELERRLSLEQENPQSISFSHAREFSGAVMNTKDPMTLGGMAKALKDLVVMQDNGKLSDAATPDYSVFMAKLREAKKVGKKSEEAAAPTATTATPATAQTHDISSLSKEQQAEIDKAAAAAVQPAAPATPAAVSSGNQAAAQPAVAPVVSQQPTLSPEEQAKMAEIEAANAPASDKLDELTGPTTEDLLAAEANDGTPVGGAGVPAATPATPTVEGQMKGKTTDAPLPSKYNLKTPEKIENAANRCLDYASDERQTPIDQSGYMLASAQLFNVLGMDDAELAVNEAWVNFNEGLNRYLASLENAVKEARGEQVLKEIQALKPKFNRPQLAK